MTTATRKPTKADPLAELDKLEAVVGERMDAARAVQRDFNARNGQAQELGERRRVLLHREPGLADHTGRPLDPKNGIAQLDEAIAELGDLDDLRAQVEHAGKLEQRARRDVEAHIHEHYDALVVAYEPKLALLAEAANAALGDVTSSLDAYIGGCQRLSGLAASVRRDSRVPALGHATGLKRELRGRSLPTPGLVKR